MDYKNAWRVRTRTWAIELLGGVCAECGDSDQLEFDHIDPKLKMFDISAGIRDGYGKDRLEAELVKCQLLCEKHHLEKTIKAASVLHGQGKSGKRNCSCNLCKAKKSEYMKSYMKSYNRKKVKASTEM